MISIELFGCSGGMAEGFRRAGLEFTWAFDVDPDACASYEANMGRRPIMVDVRELDRLVADGWTPGVVDLLVADPPCTPWSKAGKRRGLADERDMLAHTTSIIRSLRPRAFLVGNVPGLDEAPGLEALRLTIGSLASLGYCIDFRRLDAAAYGVPQHRVRPFWFGHALESRCISWPEPTHGDPDVVARPHLPGVTPLIPWVTCAQALAHIPIDELGRPVRLRKRGCTSPQHGSIPERPARVVGTSNLSDGNVLLTHPRHPMSTLDAPSRTVCTKGDGRGAQGACVLSLASQPDARRRRASSKPRASIPDAPAGVVTTRENGDGNVLTWPWDRPATTVTTRDALPPPGHHEPSVFMHPDAVMLSERAASVLQGFPDGWRFVGDTKRSRWSQIGQAMPPPLAEAVAARVLAAMGKP